MIEWREEIYPAYHAPFIWLDGNQPRCELAQFGLVPAWAADRPKFGLRTYNARTDCRKAQLQERLEKATLWASYHAKFL